MYLNAQCLHLDIPCVVCIVSISFYSVANIHTGKCIKWAHTFSVSRGQWGQISFLWHYIPLDQVWGVVLFF